VIGYTVAWFVFTLLFAVRGINRIEGIVTKAVGHVRLKSYGLVPRLQRKFGRNRTCASPPAIPSFVPSLNTQPLY
jgi:hypothetical protein